MVVYGFRELKWRGGGCVMNLGGHGDDKEWPEGSWGRARSLGGGQNGHGGGHARHCPVFARPEQNERER